MQNKIAFVTGVSSGIGREVAQLLVARGARVFGTIRGRRPAGALAGIELVRMDVTNDADVTEAVKAVFHQAGRIDVLINNAGYALGGALEETSIAEAREQFETNFFGVMRVTQAILPSMRRQGYGSIVNISSMFGVVPGPYRGIYAASKHALEAYTETLDHEVRHFGIRASLIEPSFTKTSIDTNSKYASVSLDAYAEQRRRVEQTIQQKTLNGTDPRIVAEVVYRALTARIPRRRYPVGEGVVLSALRRFLPTAFFEIGLRKQFHLDDAAQESGGTQLAKGEVAK